MNIYCTILDCYYDQGENKIYYSANYFVERQNVGGGHNAYIDLPSALDSAISMNNKIISDLENYIESAHSITLNPIDKRFVIGKGFIALA